MRALAAVVIGALVGWFVAGVVQLQLGIWFGAAEEFIAALLGQALFVAILAAVLLATLIIVPTERAVTLAAVVATAAILTGVISVEVTALTGSANAAAVWTGDLPILIELVVPMLVTAAIQWWFAWRYVRHARLRATEGVTYG